MSTSARGPGAGRSAVVIGAGIIGVATALALQRHGFQTTVIDQDEPGRGCSYRHCGAIRPDLRLPIAMPGPLRTLPRRPLPPESPLVASWPPLHLQLPPPP